MAAAVNSQLEKLEMVAANVTAVPPAEIRESNGQESLNQNSLGQVRFSSIASSSDSRSARREILVPRRTHQWKYPLLMSTFYVLGLGMSIAHCAFYSALKDTIVGSPGQQEINLRFGTAFAFLTQICLTASVWQTYTQWAWRSLRRTAMTIPTLNDIFGADTSVLSLLNLDMLTKFTVGFFIAIFAWTLILPPFFTPGTLSIYPSTSQVVIEQAVPYLTIANGTAGHLYSYSPSHQGDRFNVKEDPARVFTGPRTILTLLSTATAAQGVILPIEAPYNYSSYSIDFFGPAVQCRQADPSVESKIKNLLKQKMDRPLGNATEIENAYYAFVPAFNSQGEVTALPEVRYQSAANASNQLWMVFQRYLNTTDSDCDYEPYHQVCSLWNASYHLNLSWENGFQNITGSSDLLYEVEYPNDKPHETSNMVQHAYSAFMWALTDQVVGLFGWFNDTAVSTASKNRTFGMISSPIQHNSLLGTPDLDVFFDFNEDASACKTPYKNLSLQRQQDKDVAKNQTLAKLIEEMSFKMTVSLMHNNLLTANATREIIVWKDVNRYGINAKGIFIPYALACSFALIIGFIGAITYVRHGAFPDRRFQDFITAAEDPNVIRLARGPNSRRGSMTADFRGEHPTLRVLED